MREYLSITLISLLRTGKVHRNTVIEQTPMKIEWSFIEREDDRGG
jgi:hypothetical protein